MKPAAAERPLVVIPALNEGTRIGRVIEALREISEETVVVSHYIAINVAVGSAIGDDRITCFRPDYCSCTVLDVTALVPQQPRTRCATRLRLVSVFRRGWNLILVALLDQAPLPMGRFVPEPWPAVPVPEEETCSLPGLALPQAA